MASQTITYLLRPKAPFDAKYPLTMIDSLMPPINSKFLFIYDTRDEPTPAAEFQSDLVARLTTSLETFIQNPGEQLVGYPELLGTIYEDAATGKLSVHVSKESAIKLSVSNRPDIAFQDLRPDLQFPTRCLNKDDFALGQEPPDRDLQGGLPAFWVHITFINGGFVILANKHHFLVDGNGFSQFVTEWFKMARELQKVDNDSDYQPQPILRGVNNKAVLEMETRPLDQPVENLNLINVPGGRRTMYGIPDIPPVVISLITWVFSVVRWLIPTVTLGSYESQIFHFSTEHLRKLKDNVQAQTTTRISTNDALTALIWHSITRARHPQVPTAEELGSSKVMIMTDFRRKLTPNLPANYFGNAIQGVYPTLPVTALLPSDLQAVALTATEVRRAITYNADEAHVHAAVQYVTKLKKPSDARTDLRSFKGNDLFSSSWEAMYNSAEALELGVGKFRRIRPPSRRMFDGAFVILPAYGKRFSEGAVGIDGEYPGGIELMIDLATDSMRRLKEDELWGQFVSWADHKKDI